MGYKFNVGALVQLKSGGPSMTVSETPEGKSRKLYVCQWFKGASKEQGTFVEDVLQLYVPPTK